MADKPDYALKDDTLWRAYQEAQGSADHTARECFNEVVGLEIARLQSKLGAVQSELEKWKRQYRVREGVLMKQRDVLQGYATSRLCSDHNGKWSRGRCVLCELERAETRLDKIAKYGTVWCIDCQAFHLADECPRKGAPVVERQEHCDLGALAPLPEDEAQSLAGHVKGFDSERRCRYCGGTHPPNEHCQEGDDEKRRCSSDSDKQRTD